ncbi:MAG: hypothetical protein R2785_02805 [Flavobacteriaceae bacterium]
MISQIKLKNVNLLTLLIAFAIFISCEKGINKQSATANGFSIIEKELKSKFGENAYYTDLLVIYNASIGNIISVTVSEVPESLKMEQWNASQGAWKQNQDISIEVPLGSKASDFMFQLNDTINLTKLGALVERSNSELITQKNIENPKLYIASIKFPKNGDVSKTEYIVVLKPEMGRTSFTFSYNIDEELIKIDY